MLAEVNKLIIHFEIKKEEGKKISKILYRFQCLWVTERTEKKFSRSTVIRHLTGEKSSVNEKQTKLRQKNQTLIDFLAWHRFSVLIPVNANKSKFEKMKKLEDLGCLPRSATFNVFSQRD